MNDGRWLTGEIGTERTTRLSEKLNRQSLDKLNRERLQQFPIYRPWMSCPARWDTFLKSRFAEVPNHTDFRFVSNSEELHFLSEALHEGDLPLGAIRVTENLDMCVETQDWARVVETEKLVREALDWIESVDKNFKKNRSALILEIIPLGLTSERFSRSPEGRGLSNHLYRGGVFIDLPQSSGPLRLIDLAINLAHELGHQAFMVYQNADRIVSADLFAPVYSAIRQTDRPAIKSFHAVVALTFMIEFIRRSLESDQTPTGYLDYLYRRGFEIVESLGIGISAFVQSGIRLSDLGVRMLQECESRQRQFLAELKAS